MTKAEVYDRLLKAVIYHVQEAGENIFKEAYEDICDSLYQEELTEYEADDHYDMLSLYMKQSINEILQGVKALKRD